MAEAIAISIGMERTGMPDESLAKGESLPTRDSMRSIGKMGGFGKGDWGKSGWG
jgi:hypothetical protein